jgi:hypothetical protein
VLGGLAAGLARFGAAAAAGGPATRLGPGRATSVILIFNGGAPSHIDLWDPKPNADVSVRGMFSPIQTNVPGTHVSELLPRMAQRMDKVALVRSVHHGHSSHNGGMHWATVGRPYRVDSTLINPSPVDLPCVGTLCGWLAQRDGFTAGVPPYVITPFPTCDSNVSITPGQYGGCLGARFDPFVLDDDPNRADFRVRNLALDPGVTPERLAERLGLLQALEGPCRTCWRDGSSPPSTGRASPGTRRSATTCAASATRRPRAARSRSATASRSRRCSEHAHPSRRHTVAAHPRRSFVLPFDAGLAVVVDVDVQSHRMAAHRAVLDVVLPGAGGQVHRHDDLLAARVADVRRIDVRRPTRPPAFGTGFLPHGG